MEIPFKKKKDEETSILETAAVLPESDSPSGESTSSSSPTSIASTSTTPSSKSLGAELVDYEMAFKTKVILAGVLVAVALLSFFVIGNIADNPDTHSDTIAALDESRNNVLIMTGGALGIATAASLLPADVGEPISETLTQIISGLAVVLAVILLEKYLLTVFGFAAFKVLIPIGCLILGATLSMRKTFAPRRILTQLASKLMVFGLVLFLAIPLSVGISRMVQQTYQAQFEDTIAASESISEAAAEDIDATAEATANETDGESEQSGNLLENLGAALSSIPEAASHIPENLQQLPQTVADSASNTVSGAANKLSGFVDRYVEGFAVMIVTSCLIPIIVILLFFWLANVLLGINVSLPRFSPAGLAKRKGENAKE